ncbi:hypothetical protein BJ742DRAFT_839553 [Cladochytrium replicatum]|nr:hypothetical protein BJ742DRAFT_839553 [Cladochytrium replicatum]
MAIMKTMPIWKSLSRYGWVGRFIFSWLVTYISPYTGSIPFRVLKLAPGYCQARLVEKFYLRNPFQSIHAAALYNFAEGMQGLAVLSLLDESPHPIRGIPNRMTIEYYAKARGAVTATCSIENSDLKIEENEKDGKCVSVTEIKREADGVLVAKLWTEWNLKQVSEGVPAKL